mgnify:CR=1 FL=1
MKPSSSWLKNLAQLAVCGVLLAWIFQSIFWKEGMDAWAREQRTPVWEKLTPRERLEVSWTHGPREVWKDMARVRPEAFALSLVLMGATIFLGIARWRQVLRVHGLELSLGRATEISLVAHFFNSFLRGVREEFDFQLAERPDFLIYGPYGGSLPATGDAVRIYFGCENVRPDMRECDWAFSYDHDETVRHPRHLRAVFHSGERFVKPAFDLASVRSGKRKFCNFIYGNIFTP